MNCRSACQFLFYLVVISLAGNAAAQEERTAEDNYIDMPEAYEERQRVEERQQRLAQGDVKEYPGYVPGYRLHTSLGLSPHAPQLMPSMPGALNPPFGAVVRGDEARFQFHGYLQPTLRAGFGTAKDGPDDPEQMTVHADPVVPGGAYGWFDRTNTVPTPWVQLNFMYGNDVVKGTFILGAWSVTEADEAAGNFMGHAQMLFAQAYLSYTPEVEPIRLKIDVGAFPDRYGFMAKWHQGAYGSSLIADIYGLGATGTVVLPFVGDFDVIVEGGFKGELDKAPLGIPQDGSTDYARAYEGSSFAGHAHLGVFFAEHFTPTLHFIYNWSQDDRGDPADDPSTPTNETQQHRDGSLTVLGGDMRIDGKWFGYLYLGGSHVTGKNVGSLTDLVRILNTGSGNDFNERYWGFSSDGNGTLTLAGMQYTLSLGTLLRHPMEYWGEGPDLSVSLFGVFGRSSSKSAEIGDANMVKYGGEVAYSFARHLAASVRFDHVMPDLDHLGRGFAVISPKLILRSDWVTRESITLQYAQYLLGDDVEVHGDNRMMVASKQPDRHMLSVYGTIWW